ncbi:MAG: hypothetical protein GY798_17480 [Hyphomicrobiales bacterium]|nr:hypothetical protein [Hyphomicrobiales bacterium]
MGKYIDFSYVKDGADFPAVLAHCGIKALGNGPELRCKCPFHDDENPSMSVNVDKKVFTCHAASCGEKGNILEFVQKVLADTNPGRSSLRDAAESLAEICRIEVAPPKREKRKANGRRASKKARETKPAAANDDEAGAAVKAALENDEPLFDDDADEVPQLKPLGFKLKLNRDHGYGKSRGLSPATIEKFEMGYCSRGVMSQRWCVPLHDEAGQLVAYCGRWADDDDRPNDELKYKLPTGFSKTSVLFNLHRVLKMQANQVVVVEGVFDAIRLHERGIPAVALLGSSISEAQVALLGEATISAIVMLDGGADAARMKVVDRVAQVMLVQSVVLPVGVDPASADDSQFMSRMPKVA